MNNVESSALFIETKEKIQRAEKFLKTIRDLEAQSQLTEDLLVAELKQLRADKQELLDDAEPSQPLAVNGNQQQSLGNGLVHKVYPPGE